MAEGGQVRTTVVLGVPFSRLTNEKTLDRLDEMVRERTRNTVSTANMDFAVRAMKDPVLKRIMYMAAMVTPDGMPIVWAGRTMDPPLTERVAGSDFIPRLLERAAQRGYSVFFLGGRDDIAKRAAERSQAKNPSLRVVGVYSPPFATVWEMDNDAIVDRINAAAPDILLVAFGNPKQEYWMSMNSRRLNVPVSIGVGGTFDFLSGTIPRAPEWMKKLGAEWLFRVYKEPRRLAMRYALDIRDGLFPLVLQTAADSFLRAIRSFSEKGTREPPVASTCIVKANGSDEIRTLIIENCTPAGISEIAADIADYAAREYDAIIVNLGRCWQISSRGISDLTFIDQVLRRQTKHCIVIAGSLCRFVFRIAHIDDILTVVRSRDEAMQMLHSGGKRTLSFSEDVREGQIKVIAVRGELTNATLPLFSQLRSVLPEREPVLFDFTGVRSLDPGGLHCLLEYWEEIRSQEPLHCLSTHKHIRAMLGTNGLRERIRQYMTLEEALAGLRTLPGLSVFAYRQDVGAR